MLASSHTSRAVTSCCKMSEKVGGRGGRGEHSG